MKILKMVILVIVIALSLAAGSAKIMQMPQEMTFFQQAGLASNLVLPLGLLQAIGGILLVFSKTRFIGAILATLSFLASAITIFLTGAIGFGLFSLLPMLMAAYVMLDGRLKLLK